MKRILTVFLIIYFPNVFAQMPVTDGAAIARSMQNQVATMAKWKTQNDQMLSQIHQLEREYASITGSRDLGEIMNNPELRDYLPQDWQAIYDSVKQGGYEGLSGTGKTVYDDNKVYDGCAYITIPDQKIACEARAVKPSQDKGFALDAYSDAKNRMLQIDELMQTINETQDPKAIAELQSRIAIEQANIQNEQTKLQLYEMVSAAESRVQAQRQREIQARTWSARKGIYAEPLTFD